MAFPLDGTKQQGATAKRTCPQITLHTTENAPGTRNSALANFIRTRSDYGSYHTLCDTFGEWMQLAGFRSMVWHAPAVNRFAMGHSFTTRASDWKALSKRARKALIEAGAMACHRYSRWCVNEGVGPVLPRRLSRAQALAGMSGFSTHALVQPADRSDPGAGFPWGEFLAAFTALENAAKGSTTPVTKIPKPKPVAPKEPTMKPSQVWTHRATIDYVGGDPKNRSTQQHKLSRAHQYAFESVQLLRGITSRIWNVKNNTSEKSMALHTRRGDLSETRFTSRVSGNSISAATALLNAQEKATVSAQLAAENGAKLDALAESLDKLAPGLEKRVAEAAAAAASKAVKSVSAKDVAAALEVVAVNTDSDKDD